MEAKTIGILVVAVLLILYVYFYGIPLFSKTSFTCGRSTGSCVTRAHERPVRPSQTTQHPQPDSQSAPPVNPNLKTTHRRRM